MISGPIRTLVLRRFYVKVDGSIGCWMSLCMKLDGVRRTKTWSGRRKTHSRLMSRYEMTVHFRLIDKIKDFLTFFYICPNNFEEWPTYPQVSHGRADPVSVNFKRQALIWKILYIGYVYFYIIVTSSIIKNYGFRNNLSSNILIYFLYMLIILLHSQL